MYVIVVYDVKQERVNKFCKFLRMYLHHVQNSVFEGELTESQYEEIKYSLKKMVKDRDSVILFCLRNKWFNREIIGLEKNAPSNLI